MGQNCTKPQKSEESVLWLGGKKFLKSIRNSGTDPHCCLQNQQNGVTVVQTKQRKVQLKPEPITLQNLAEPERVLFDTLHQKALQQYSEAPANSTGFCPAGVCQGSLLMPVENIGGNPTPRDSSVTHAYTNKNSLLDNNEALYAGVMEIEDFFNQYFRSEKSGIVDQERLSRVIDEYVESGIYKMTRDELMFGCKTAWRNASRCSGRIQWSKLELFDCRDLETTDELAEVIFDHLEYSTNGGNIRSAILVTAAEGCGTQFRIWNSQYLIYAGYKTPGEPVVGDPVNVDITKIALQLGWKPNGDGTRTRFDILPLILQKGSENPVFYPIPKRLVLEVPIQHSRYPKLREMNLKWYAVPGVSFMSLECGGLVYKCTGFNGWYMSTEITRDLMDIQRYNLLPAIAESFNLDISKPKYEWMDIAAAQLNIAIMSSFQENSVTIVDHHTGIQSFMKHLENEQVQRGGCPADWVWITPPLGGTLTPAFHQEMLNYKLKPSYEYQAQPWIGFQWKGELKLVNRRPKLSLRCVTRVMMVCFRLMKAALKQRRQCTILYATETGTSEKFATQLHRIFDSNFDVELTCMNDYDIAKLRYAGMLLVVASTFGNGEAPDNGKKFESNLEQMIEEYKTGSYYTSSLQSEQESPTDKSFAVFGLGSTSYPNFGAFSKRVDAMLQDFGFSRILDIGLGDQLANQESAFSDWSNKLFRKVSQLCGSLSQGDEDVTPPKLSFKVLNSLDSLSESVNEGLIHVHRKPITTGIIRDVHSLTTESTSSNTIFVKLSCEGSTYEVGDHIAVYPRNPADKVKFILSRCYSDHQDVDLNAPLKISLSEKDKMAEKSKHHPQLKTLTGRLPVCTLLEALTYYFDLSTPPSRDDLKLLLENCSCSDLDRENINELIKNDGAYLSWTSKRLGWFELLHQCSSLKLNVDSVFVDFRLLQPRYYSISSCAEVSPGEVDLTVSVLNYSVDAGGSELEARQGLCSNYLNECRIGDSVHFVIKRTSFCLRPQQQRSCIIMICAGSGIAPFRGFWQQGKLWKENEKDNDPSGNMALYFGCKTPSVQLYKNEIEECVSQGVIDEYHVAFSRSGRHAKKYVQDLLRDDKSNLMMKLAQENTTVYVCGDIKMATGVSTELDAILMAVDNSNSRSRRASKETPISCSPLTVKQMRAEGRYFEDIYSILI